MKSFKLNADMTRPSLEKFVRDNMLSAEELLRRARRAHLPEECRCCGNNLEKMCGRFEKIPTRDATMIFSHGGVMILAFDQGENCTRMAEGVCHIVCNHLRRALRARSAKDSRPVTAAA